jgi:hypothetical protein
MHAAPSRAVATISCADVWTTAHDLGCISSHFNEVVPRGNVAAAKNTFTLFLVSEEHLQIS